LVEKRNTSKEKLKRNKAFPYKSKRKLNDYESYVIVDKEGKEYGKFRLKATAILHTNKLISRHKKKFDIIKLKESILVEQNFSNLKTKT